MNIVAKKGAQTVTFTEKQWKEMPADKYGWIPVAEEPEEVKALKAQKEVQPETEPSEETIPVAEEPEEVKVEKKGKSGTKK